MMRRALLRSLGLAVLAIATIDLTVNADDAPGGLRPALHTDRELYHPGEVVHLVGSVKNNGDTPTKVPVLLRDRAFLVVRLHVELPDGADLIYEPPDSRRPLKGYEFKTAVAAGAPATVFELPLRVGADLAHWRNLNAPARPISFRGAGTYRAWFEYTVELPPKSPPGAWSGTARSNTAAWTVRPLTAAERVVEPTDAQKTALHRFRAMAPAFDNKDATFLQAELLRAQNEGLARWVFDLLRDGGNAAADSLLLNMLTARLASREPDGTLVPGVDDPTLKILAQTTVAAIEHPPADPNSLRLFRAPMPGALDATLAYLRLHPDDEATRMRLEAMARRSARIRTLDKPSGERRAWASDGPMQPVAAWTTLLDLGVLHAEMSVAEATAILGAPTDRRNAGSASSTLSWYLNSPRHVNPGLRAEVRKETIVRFWQFSG